MGHHSRPWIRESSLNHLSSVRHPWTVLSPPASSSSSRVALFNKSFSSDSPSFMVHEYNWNHGHHPFNHRMSYPLPRIVSRESSASSRDKCDCGLKSLIMAYLSRHKSLLILSMILVLTGFSFISTSYIAHLEDKAHTFFLIGIMFSTFGLCVTVVMLLFSCLCCRGRKKNISSSRVSAMDPIPPPHNSNSKSRPVNAGQNFRRQTSMVSNPSTTTSNTNSSNHYNDKTITMPSKKRKNESDDYNDEEEEEDYGHGHGQVRDTIRTKFNEEDDNSSVEEEFERRGREKKKWNGRWFAAKKLSSKIGQKTTE